MDEVRAQNIELSRLNNELNQKINEIQNDCMRLELVNQDLEGNLTQIKLDMDAQGASLRVSVESMTQ